jgi:hypothetical protein
MTVLHRIPEERISAVMGVPAIIAGLGAGLDRSTLANTREMGEMFTERKLVPQWRADAAKLNVSLKPDFTDDRDISIAFDQKNVRALQEDENDKFERLKKATGEKAFMKRNEARAEIGLDPLDEWEEEDLSPPQLPPQFQAQGSNGNQPEEEQEEELRQWRTWAVNRVGRKGAFDREFETFHTPPALAGAIEGALEGANTADEVKAIFDDPWLGYP